MKLKLVIITDSRGRVIDPTQFSNLYSVSVSIHPGKGAIEAIPLARPLLTRTNPDIIVLAIGICDLTERVKNPLEFRLRHDTKDESIMYVLSSLQEAWQDLRTSFSNAKILMSTIIGIELNVYNNRTYKHMSEEMKKTYNESKTLHPDQERMDDTILDLNREILRINTSRDVPTAFIANIIHKYYKKAYHHHYNLLSDGCHITSALGIKIVHIIEVSIHKLYRKRKPEGMDENTIRKHPMIDTSG